MEKGVWKGLEGGNGREKCCNKNTISKTNKLKEAEQYVDYFKIF